MTIQEANFVWGLNNAEKAEDQSENDQKIACSAWELEAVKKFADHQFILASAENPDGDYIGVDFNGQWIIDPWHDPSGRRELTDEDAIKVYGVDLINAFCHKVLQTTKKPEDICMAESVKAACQCIWNAYINQEGDASMCDFLASTKFPMLSAEDVVQVYCTLMNRSDGDVFLQIQNYGTSEEYIADMETWKDTGFFCHTFWHNDDLDDVITKHGLNKEQIKKLKKDIFHAFADHSSDFQLIDEIARDISEE